MDIGKTLIVFGLVLIIAGTLFSVFSNVTSLPKFPGDIYIKRDGFTFYFPIVTSILISIILSLIFYLFFRK